MVQKKDQTKLIVKQRDTVRFVEVKDIVYIESIGRKAAIHFMDETIEYYATLSSLTQKLQPGFFLIHRSYLINLSYLKSYHKKEATMANGDCVPISKYRLSDFEKQLENLGG